jgi:hypothetical protein
VYVPAVELLKDSRMQTNKLYGLSPRANCVNSNKNYFPGKITDILIFFIKQIMLQNIPTNIVQL